MSAPNAAVPTVSEPDAVPLVLLMRAPDHTLGPRQYATVARNDVYDPTCVEPGACRHACPLVPAPRGYRRAKGTPAGETPGHQSRSDDDRAAGEVGFDRGDAGAGD